MNKSFTYVSQYGKKSWLISMRTNQSLREFYVERFVVIGHKRLSSICKDDMMKYMEELPDNEALMNV